MLRRLRSISLLVASLLAVAPTAAQEPAEVIRTLIAAESHPDLSWSNLDDVATALAAVYGRRQYSPLWVDGGEPTAQARVVVEELEAARERGLRASDYSAAHLRQRIQEPPADADSIARLDVALTASLLRFLQHVHVGRISPRQVGFGLHSELKHIDLPPVIAGVAATSDPRAQIAAHDPPFPLFDRLRRGLAIMRELEVRELPEIPTIPTLRPGEASEATPALRARLAAFGDLPESHAVPADESLYDEELAVAVERFQRRHGLEADGVIGRNTLAALQVPIAQRTEQIELAIERLRWLPPYAADRFLIVNIPEFRLSAFEAGHAGAVMHSEVVVGSAARRNETPILSAEMRYVVFRPFWNVPSSIIRDEILPKLDLDPEYLEQQNMERINGRIRQRPGPDNSLGLIKFIFPNRHHVYLHDTPSKALFRRARRDFSHGCIRVARPVDLAEFVLRGQGSWTRERISAAMQHGRDNVYVKLDTPIPVYLLYSTVIVSSEGEIRFFGDIYDHDSELRNLLAKAPPYK